MTDSINQGTPSFSSQSPLDDEEAELLRQVALADEKIAMGQEKPFEQTALEVNNQTQNILDPSKRPIVEQEATSAELKVEGEKKVMPKAVSIPKKGLVAMSQRNGSKKHFSPAQSGQEDKVQFYHDFFTNTSYPVAGSEFEKMMKNDPHAKIEIEDHKGRKFFVTNIGQSISNEEARGLWKNYMLDEAARRLLELEKKLAQAVEDAKHRDHLKMSNKPKSDEISSKESSGKIFLELLAIYAARSSCNISKSDLIQDEQAIGQKRAFKRKEDKEVNNHRVQVIQIEHKEEDRSDLRKQVEVDARNRV